MSYHKEWFYDFDRRNSTSYNVTFGDRTHKVEGQNNVSLKSEDGNFKVRNVLYELGMNQNLIFVREIIKKNKGEAMH